MLKNKLVRSGFIGQGMLLLMPSVTTDRIEPIYVSKEMTAQLYELRGTSSDTLIVDDISDSSATYMFTEEDYALAPKVELNKNATKYVKSFIKREKFSLDKISARSQKHFRMIDSIFTLYGIPVEMKYLAVVESEMKSTALSRVGARGMWQFMPVTAKEMGLKITSKYDERTHVKKSTVAAAKYLKYLFSEFNDWLLVLAAYNGGPGTVYKAIKKSGSRNFWALQYHLPTESRGHVKRFIGVHYYYEGTGSITTQTRAEAIAFEKKYEEYFEELKSSKELASRR